MSEETNPTPKTEAPLSAAGQNPVSAPVAAAPAAGKPRSSPLPLVATMVSLVALGVAAAPHFKSPDAELTVVPENGVTMADLDAVRTSIPDTASLARDVAALKARIAALEMQVSMAPAPANASSATGEAADLALLLQRVAALEARPAAQPVDIAPLEKAVEELRREVGADSKTDDAQKTLMVATLQLVSAWQAGQVFEAPWVSALAAAGIADPALALELDDAAPTLLPWRDKGIPRLSRLTADFPAMAQAVVAAAAPAGEGWMQQSLARIKGLVVIRRQGENVPGDDEAVDAILARAEVRLNKGDLNGTVQELDKLSETAVLPAEDWLSAARARLRVDALAAKMAQRAASGLLGTSAAMGEAEAADDAAPEADAPVEETPEALPDTEGTSTGATP
mgnify:CR=1 FL=1